ncbi:class I adenylate-forming enzyme family protein [Fervidibacillus halotolerans]|uniref:Long-chain-fatty-acid--CoA ligase n=1 Tax=Fervidibacillus halotolerans TaxID=2980027 RepID=A0A9E8RY02_9BACI|nr:long-chain-fatty-acid--CoA ligase [Fervidibacillus halotolerans]WAA11703.1 long-chain-fatty-acid--CoA ligase [Fervidibacillus halotolerans]
MLNVNIGELMTHRAYLSPKTEGYVGRKRYSFSEMNQRVNQFAHFLQQENIQTGDRIALLCKNHEDFITAFFGAAKLGVITVPINWRLQTSEIIYILQNAEPTLLVHDVEFEEKIKEVLQHVPLKTVEAGDERFDAYIEPFPTAEVTPVSKGDDTILIMYTSGTTGKPKGAMITHTNLLAASLGMSHTIDWWFGDRFLSVAPFFHIGGFAPIITNVHTGSTVVLMADFDPIAVWKTIDEEKITTMMTVPVMLQYMLKVFDKEKMNYKSLRNITCGASPVPESLIRAYDQLGIPIQQVYGITEYTGAVSFWKKIMGQDKIRSMGKMVFHGNVKIVDPATNEPLPPNKIGEIVCSGPQVFKGYWKNEEETKKVLNEGDYRSGDIGKIDEEGFIYVIDRLKDMIISGGENIYSSELENVIASHPDVVEVAVVGVPDEKWGEVPKAFVVKSKSSPLKEEDIIQLCKKHLASYKCVKDVEFISQLPRNASGKVLKHVLKTKKAVH